MVFDQTGSLANVSRHDYLPFGEELYAGTGGRTTAQGYTLSDNVRQKFTSKERDNETGLDYFLARYYLSTQGRFISPDPLMIDEKKVRDPQRLNFYTYALNNPIRFVDPDGADPKEPRTVVVVLGGGYPSSGGSNEWKRVQPYGNVDGLGEKRIDAESPHIAQQIKNEFPNADVIFGGPYASDAIFKDLTTNKPDHIILYGYSMGGVAALELANALAKNGQTVDQLTTVDPVCKCQFSDYKIENTNMVHDAMNFYISPYHNPVIGATQVQVYEGSGHRQDDGTTPPTRIEHLTVDDITSPHAIDRIRDKLKEISQTEQRR